MIKKIQNILKDLKIDAWLLVNSENKDAYYKKIISPNTTILSVAIITQKKIKVIVHSLDADNLKDLGREFLIKQYGGKISFEKVIVKEINQLRNLKKIALNYTTMNDVNVDILGYGFYKYITDIIVKNSNSIKKRYFVSAERIIYALYDRKTLADIHKLKIAAKRANQILNDAFKKIRPGMTEFDLVELVHKITQKKPAYFKKEGIIEEEYAWEEESCPIALTGLSFKKGGHALSSKRKVKEGSTVYFDFGVKLTFKDNTQWSSDLQRTAYILKKNEKIPPKNITNRFNAIINSISKGIDKIQPGMKGYEIDKIVRESIISKGYPNYDHATGHSIGELAHNPGTVLSTKKNKMACLEIQPNGVYTIEPRIPMNNGVSIEEMVVVYEGKHAETLCERQMTPIIIKF